jgi:hypothetical protein
VTVFVFFFSEEDLKKKKRACGVFWIEEWYVRLTKHIMDKLDGEGTLPDAAA